MSWIKCLRLTPAVPYGAQAQLGDLSDVAEIVGAVGCDRVADLSSERTSVQACSQPLSSVRVL
jgi:hypothetical protein